MPETQPSFIQKQSEFSAYIRDPENNPAPKDVKKQRMEMYRELFFNNISSFLISNFPVLHRILDDTQWTDLAQDFFSGHSCETPYFSEIPEEFIRYLQDERKEKTNDPPFMLELAHYEWVESVLMISKETFPNIDPSLQENPVGHHIALSPLAWPLAYRFPVHKISMEFQPNRPSEHSTYLVVYRDSEYEVRFLVITPVIFRMLEILQERESWLAEDVIQQMTIEFSTLKPDVIKLGCQETLIELAKKGIVYKA